MQQITQAIIEISINLSTNIVIMIIYIYIYIYIFSLYSLLDGLYNYKQQKTNLMAYINNSPNIVLPT